MDAVYIGNLGEHRYSRLYGLVPPSPRGLGVGNIPNYAYNGEKNGKQPASSPTNFIKYRLCALYP